MESENNEETEIIPDEEELFDIGGCKIFVTKDGEAHMVCDKPIDVKLGKQEIAMLQGLSELVSEEKEE